jgi:hypothetical protein
MEAWFPMNDQQMRNNRPDDWQIAFLADLFSQYAICLVYVTKRTRSGTLYILNSQEERNESPKTGSE